MRLHIPSLAAAMALLVLLPAAAAAQGPDYSKVEITTTPLAAGVYMLAGEGGNLGVSVGDDGVFLIDDEYAPLTPKIEAAIKALNPRPLRFVINTHWHGDHTGGNENLGKAGVLIVAQDNVRQRMSTEQFIALFGRKVEPSPAVALPVVTFSDTVTFYLNGDEIYVFHVLPAHTDGDAIIHFRQANVIHMGDVFFNGMYPFIDLSSGGSLDGVIAAAETVLRIADEKTKLIPGHGPVASRAELAAYRDMLKTIRDRVALLVDAGKSLDEIVAARPTAAYDETLGQGFIKPDVFTKIVVESLQQAKARGPQDPAAE